MHTYQVHLCAENGEALKIHKTDCLLVALETAAAWHELMLDRLANLTYRKAQFVVIHRRNTQGDYDGLASFHHS